MNEQKLIEERNRIFNKYKYLIKKTIIKCNIPDSAVKDMESYGYIVLIEFIDYYKKNKHRFYNKTNDEIPKSLVLTCLKRAIAKRFTRYIHIYGHGAKLKPQRMNFIENPKEIDEKNKDNSKNGSIHNYLEKISCEQKYDFEIIDKIKSIMNENFITQRQKEILTVKFGLNDGIEKTCKETAAIIGGTFQNVNYVEAKAFNNIKQYYHEFRDLL